jgi:hypothetical protein
MGIEDRRNRRPLNAMGKHRGNPEAVGKRGKVIHYMWLSAYLNVVPHRRSRILPKKKKDVYKHVICRWRAPATRNGRDMKRGKPAIVTSHMQVQAHLSHGNPKPKIPR